MIVVVGSPIAEPTPQGVVAGGLSSAIAIAAARGGAAVQLVGRVGEDAAGDEVLLSLAAAGVEHVAVLREAGRPTPAAAPTAGESPSPDGPALGESVLDEPADAGQADDVAPAGLSVDAADVELALRYVPDYRVVVIAADLDEAAIQAVVGGAGWAGARLIAVVGSGRDGATIPSTATVLERPSADGDGAFAAMVAAYAGALDRGSEPADAFAAAQRDAGWAAVGD